MSAFACKTRNESGELVEKTVDAGSKREVLQLLERAGLSPIKVEQIDVVAPKVDAKAEPRAARTVARTAARNRRGKVKRKELMNFSIQLSSTLSAGVPILAGLHSIRTQTKNEAFKAVLGDLILDLEGGSPLSEGMRKHPKVFPAVYVGTIEAGEASSTLDEMLENLAEYLEAEMEMRSDVRSAVMYPAIVICVLFVAITVLIVFIVPRFAAFYSGFDAELPLATQILIGGSTFMADHFMIVLGGLAGLVFGVLRLLRLPGVRRAVDRALLRVPLIGRLIETGITLHVVQMLGLFTKAGVPVLEGLRTISSTIANTRYRGNLQAVAAGVAVGQTLADGLEETGCFPPSARQMLANGEATGSLERACFAVARHYKKELRYLTKNVSTFIEPLLTLFLAVVVLFVALAAFLPMWDLVKVIGK